MKGLLTVLISLAIGFGASAQSGKFRFNIEGQGLVTSKDHVPFWMRSNQFGSIPLSGPSASLIGQIKRDYDTTSRSLVDWGISAQGRVNGGKGSELILLEGYGKVRVGIFELKGGRSKDAMGLTDTLLTTGNFAISGNALGIPKVQLSIQEFYTLPIFGRIFAFKGDYSYGWLGTKGVLNKRVDDAVTYFHQKSIWVRIGKDDWKFRFYGGFNDNAFWGNERKIFESFILSDWKSYTSVVLGKDWADSKVGNHVGSIDVRFEYDFKKVRVAAYRQNFYEVGGLYHLANIADGLNGLSFTNKSPGTKTFKWKKFLFEFLYTKNQAGETWSKPTPTGNENYYNHNLYAKGWSYQSIGLGSPFITPSSQVRDGFPTYKGNYFINNRLFALHGATIGSIGKWEGLAKISYSRNFGTHHTKDTFIPANQFSAVLEGNREIGRDLYFGGTLAFDAGKLLNNSFGAMVRMSKTF